MRFSDGMTFDTSGPLRKVRKSDGLYVVGNGMLVPVNDDEEARKLIESLSSTFTSVRHDGLNRIVEVPPDTASSVRSYLRDETSLVVSEATACTPDPLHMGVWKVTNVTDPHGMKMVVVVYLAGYANGLTGRTRRYTDFECCMELDSVDG